MPRMTLVRYATKPECADEHEALSRAVDADLRAAAPAHITYAVFRGGTEFVHLLVNAKDDSADAITELPSFKHYQNDILARCITPPEVTRVNFDLIVSYGLQG